MLGEVFEFWELGEGVVIEFLGRGMGDLRC